VFYPAPPLAVIDGTLCQLTREGTPVASYRPLATAIVEFRRGPLCVYVREHPHGLLPGIANVYCLDGGLALRWLAEWPESAGPCTRIVSTTAETVTLESATGAEIELDGHTGQLLRINQLLAAAG
jgi:hypothetical protein